MKFRLTEDYNFIPSCEKFIKEYMDKFNKFLDDYGFEIEYREDYWEDCAEHNDDWVGVFVASEQDIATVFPIAVNIPLIQKWYEDNDIDFSDICTQLKMTIVHEAGHGIYQYLTDFFYIDEDEEKCVEDFAKWYVDNLPGSCTLIDMMKELWNGYESEEVLTEAGSEFAYTTKEFEQILKYNGYVYNRSKGDHDTYTKKGCNPITIMVGKKNPNAMVLRRLIKENNLEIPEKLKRRK